MQLTRVPHHGAVDQDLGAPARVPRQELGIAELHVHAGRTPNQARGLEGVLGLEVLRSTPGALQSTLAGGDHRHVERLLRQGLGQLIQLRLGRPLGHGWHRGRLAFALRQARQGDLLHAEQRDVLLATGGVASQGIDHGRQQRGAQGCVIGLQRVLDLHHVAARIVLRQAPLVEDVVGDERRR